MFFKVYKQWKNIRTFSTNHELLLIKDQSTLSGRLPGPRPGAGLGKGPPGKSLVAGPCSGICSPVSQPLTGFKCSVDWPPQPP